VLKKNVVENGCNAFKCTLKTYIFLANVATTILHTAECPRLVDSMKTNSSSVWALWWTLWMAIFSCMPHNNHLRKCGDSTGGAASAVEAESVGPFGLATGVL